MILRNAKSRYYQRWQAGCLFLLACLMTNTAARAEQSPIEVLQGMSDRVIELVRKDPGILDDHDRLRSYAYEIVVPNIDFVVLSQWVLGKHWRKATPQQRRIIAEEFREVLLRSYLSSFTRDDYQDQTIEYLPVRKVQGENRVVVEANIEQHNGPLMHVQFRMLRQGGNWRVYDVVVEGVSLVLTHRSSFSRTIREKGLDGLIAQLEQRNIRETPRKTPPPDSLEQ